VAQQEGERIVQKAPYVDLVFGTDNISEIPKLLEKKKGQRKGVFSTERRRKGLVPQGGTDFKSVPFPSEVSSLPIMRNHPVKAYVNIVDGCDKFCTYCVVPHTRGREKSRQPEDICREIEGLASAGYKEVTLLGQNVDSYGKDTGGHTDLADLLHRINDISGIMNIRFVTSHPADFSDRLINAMKRLPKVCEHLHLPLQSGSDAVLERMKRNYTYPEYRDKIRRLREAIPDVAVTTDIITGFPGETTGDFDKTLEAIEELQYDSIFAFKYSKRPYTAARLYDEQVSREVSEERLSRVLEIQDRITLTKNQACIGREFDILIEGESKKDKRNLTGRTRGYKIVHLPMEEGISIGDFVRVRITSSTLASLKGEVVRQGDGL
jgi:tRNA-2-methylthio-N6-dimethylallyladenosine synthase